MVAKHPEKNACKPTERLQITILHAIRKMQRGIKNADQYRRLDVQGTPPRVQPPKDLQRGRAQAFRQHCRRSRSKAFSRRATFRYCSSASCRRRCWHVSWSRETPSPIGSGRNACPGIISNTLASDTGGQDRSANCRKAPDITAAGLGRQSMSDDWVPRSNRSGCSRKQKRRTATKLFSMKLLGACTSSSILFWQLEHPVFA